MDVSVVFPVTTFVQGDTWSLNVDLSDYGYDATLYTLSYTLKIAASSPITITSTANPDHTFLMKVTAATTETYLPGNYLAIAQIHTIATGEKYTVCTTQIIVQPDLTTSLSAFDPRSPNQIILDEINAALALCFGDAVVEYTIGGRMVKKNKMELLKAKMLYTKLVRSENGLCQGQMINVYNGWF